MSICVYLWLILFVAFTQVAHTQVRPVNDYGALGLGQLLKRLNTTASVMMIGAHPDDEDSALLAYLARGENARTAYLSLTRGDGGQNIIGPELFESLGVIRTEELLQARRLDGAEQYFTRAYDYGFSKTLDEAKQKWPEDVIKCDVVRAIRAFRPLVVISRFSGTPRDGHGQHQYAGYISPLAVKSAADPQACKGAGEPWQVLKFYIEQGFGDNFPPPTLRVNTGAYDSILGRSYFEIAMEGRSQHRSQGEGRIEYHGEQFSGVNLVSTITAKVENEWSIFDGINTSTKINISALEPNLLARLTSEMNVVGADIRKSAELKEAIRLASGFQIDALADRETVVAGESFFTAVKVFAANNDIKVKEIKLKAPNGWTVAATDDPKDNNAALSRREVAGKAAYFNLKVAQNAQPTQPYWLENTRDGDLFRWQDDENRTFPFQPQPIVAQVKIELNGTEISIDQPVQYRYADPSRGEIRREVNVVPAVSVEMSKRLSVVSYSTKTRTVPVAFTVTNNVPHAVSGRAFLSLSGSGLSGYKGGGQTFDIQKLGGRATLSFDVTIPPGEPPGGTHFVVGFVDTTQGSFRFAMRAISYPHIQTHRIYEAAMTQIAIFDLKVAPAKVGYIMGSGDDVPEAIRQMGLNVTMLDEKDLASGDLSRFDTIVVGIRASETRPDFVSNFGRLTDYMKRGGNLIVQYQRGNFAKSGLTPYTVDTEDKQKTAAGSIARVVDENAKVTILEPQHPIFNFPNKITEKDFDGWVQERNAYNLVTFDPQYTPLLESHDSGEAENKGGLVIAKVGKGNYIYCSYSMFRQLPAAVPGAYRLFANLLSLPKARK